MTKELKLFVAYAHEDRDAVVRLIEALKHHQWKVYWDEELAAGQAQWHATLERELHAAFGVIVVWSEHSAKSDAVLKEATIARDAKHLYGVSIDGAGIPPEFADHWSVDLRGWNGDPADSRIDKILAWPKALSAFHVGLGYPIPVLHVARFKRGPRGALT